MTLSDLYDKIAKYYSKIDYFQINSSALLAATEQLQNTCLFSQRPVQVLDLGSGNGRFLELIHELNPHASLVAVDVSADMLKLVKERIPRISIMQASINDINQRLPPAQFDLVLAGFVCAYVGLPMLLKQAHYLLKETGSFILLTTTREAFPRVQEQVEQTRTGLNPWKKLLYFWMKKTLRATLVPKNFAEIELKASQSGFQILQYQQLKTQIVFNTPQEAQDFAEHGGWALSLIDYPWLPTFLLKKLARQMLHYISFPFHDQVIVEVISLQKK